MNAQKNSTRSVYFLLAIVACISFLSCGKDKPPVVTNPNPFAFDLSGVRSLNIENNGKDSIRLNITRKSGTSEKITLSLEGLPSGISYAINPSEGLPPFSPMIVISASNAPLSTYPVTLKATTSSGTTPYSFSITTFKEDIECIPGLVGSYSADEDCQGSPVHNYTATVETNPNNKKGIVIKNFANVGIDVKATVICGSNSLIIEEQQIGDYNISGSGSLSPKKLKIDYKLTAKRITTVYTVECSATYLKF